MIEIKETDINDHEANDTNHGGKTLNEMDIWKARDAGIKTNRIVIQAIRRIRRAQNLRRLLSGQCESI